MSRARNSASTWASSLSLLRVDSAITRSFLGWAGTTRWAKRLDEADKPFVAGGGFDDGLELAEIFKEAADRFLVGAGESGALDDFVGLGS
jgi:hypothetical protein